MLPSAPSLRRRVRELRWSRSATSSMPGMRPGEAASSRRTCPANPVRARHWASRSWHWALVSAAVCASACGSGSSSIAAGIST
ncbi:hypothetical protein RKE29_09005 [Streptomyces sp. B1866]|uniref:hypothetical protein n=1 Tax=Streptomyces sp. B1866 TaxID=3075431 RepID=UPI0028915C2F|nr:hypothetical protein [Streptomyces sp. B1866]MDT3396778.1 hypothetical protein [Streptomyces sp. B1866]